MASKVPRSKLDHDSRARCRKQVLEAPREPPRPKTHWDHVLEEMVWLSKDFESERKWKIAQAKKVALRASKGILDQATRGEKKMKEEEQRMRKVALNISKDVKKFWTKIEKLVLYKHQLKLDDKKKKALDKQLEYLLGQTERYSSMLAENLSCPSKKSGSIEPSKMELCHREEERKNSDNSASSFRELHSDDESNKSEADNDYDIHSEDDMEDDEQTIEEDEALITEDERKEELAALQNEVDLPLEELLKRYSMNEVNGERSPEKDSIIKLSVEGVAPKDAVDSSSTCQMNNDGSPIISDNYQGQSNGFLKNLENHSLEVDAYLAKQYGKENRDLENGPNDYDFNDDQEDGEFLAEGVLADGEDKDDENTIEEEEELAKVDSSSPIDEIALLQKESEIPLEELLARYKVSADDGSADDSVDDDDLSNTSAQLEELGSQPDPDIIGEQQSISMAGDDVSGELPPTSPSLKDEALVGQSIISQEGSEKESTIADAAAAARSAQPTGNTFSTTNVCTKFPFLLKYPLREYQHIGLDWLVTMYEKRLNGILADEMGLGKTIMTIALLAHLACEKGIWGPHLIVVPTSVMLNWETEFLKWCPAFKILTYFGSARERKYKRQGWMKSNYFHVCITTYRLVIQDSKIFKRKKWKYLILDEAHLIKNWKSQRWQTLLNFNSKRRILLTGTPLQNDLMELWSLMHFLMPHVFQSHQEFKDWFCNPISGMVEGQEKVNVEVIDRLHNVLRPFILRRLKRDVEKQLPMKHEHVIYCRLSKRQRNLYEDFIASSETQATLASSNFFGMLNVIMQLRKVCNHPDLFEGRPIISSFDMAGIERQFSSDVCSVLSASPFSFVDLSGLGLVFTHLDFYMTSWESDEVKSIDIPSQLIMDRVNDNTLEVNNPKFKHCSQSHDTNIFQEIRMAIFEERMKEARDRAAAIAWWNSLRYQKKPTYSTTLRELVTVRHPVDQAHFLKANTRSYHYSSKLADIVLSPVERFQSVIDQVESFMFSIPAARAPPPVCWCSKSESPVFISPSYKERCSEVLLPLLTPLRPAIVRRQLYFPDRRLLQFDCGKLQQLAILLRRLKSEGHKALIFTQMTKMLDILEAFINLYGYTYMRLDGSTQPEERQTSMQRFNTNPKIFLFILSTRSGGVGINLVGADTVIFYDSDWNPAMDQQAQDRCHRIGQTREVNIYRLISESTIEENILKKANQKRALDDLVIQSGGYNTEFFKKLDPMELFSGHKIDPIKDVQIEKSLDNGNLDPVSNCDLEAALRFAEDEADYMALKRVELEEAVDNQEFTEENIGRLEDDDLVNDDDTKVDDPADQKVLITTSNKETKAPSKGNDPDGEKALAFVCNDDDVDMLADVKQMAEAAAAAGHSVSTFENQLRPIDRYAMQFLEMWDPIIDKAALAEQTKFEETEWELERIEKLKEDMEAEIDEDEEPLVYERWDADFATQAYKQQVEALAQNQLMEEMERKAKEQEIFEDVDFVENEETIGSKPKSKKKSKKKTKKVKKLKSLKNESMHPTANSVMEEYMDSMLTDDENTCSEGEGAVSVDMVSSDRIPKKRKAEENIADSGEKILKHKAKKAKKVPLSQCLPINMSKMSGKLNGETRGSKLFEIEGVDLELRPASRSKTGKISIISTPTKRILMIRQEKPRKKGSIWSSDCYPSPDAWLPQEDAVLCALVHEYGSNWSLVSDSLYGMTSGGFYRGRFRHPFHCCERFRDLVQKFVLSVADNLNNDKASNTGAGKALLRVSEENIRTLLETVTELQDREMLLQRHFTALLSSIWRTTARHDRKLCLSVPQNSIFGFRIINVSSSLYGGQNIASGSSEKMKFINVSECRRLVGRALLDVDSSIPSDFDGTNCVTKKKKEVISQTWGILEVTLELGGVEKDESIDAFPSMVTLSILDADPPLTITSEENRLKSCQHIVENRFRCASNGNGLGWGGISGFSGESMSRSAPALALGKHKLPAVEVNKTSRSKLRKTVTEPFPFENRSLAMVVEEPLPLPLPEPATPLSFDPVCPQLHLTSDFTENTQFSAFGFDAAEPLDAPNSDLVPHFYSPDFISGLEDCLLLPDFTDIG